MKIYEVNNKKAIRRLSSRSFNANASRNLIAVIAIALTAILFTALFTVGSGLVETYSSRRCARRAATEWHI